MPRRRHLSTPAAAAVTAVAAVVTALVTVAGCSPGAVAVVPPTADPRAGPPCAALRGALPEQVMGGERRPTDPASDRTAAWGDDPTVTLTCGGPAPARAGSSADLVEIDGAVSWLPVPLDGGGYDLYAYGRAVWVRVSVPRPGSANPVDAAAALTPAVSRTVPAA